MKINQKVKKQRFKIRKYVLLGTLSLVTSTFFTGCGSSSSTSTDTQTGYFIDAPVQGLSYKTVSGLTGITDNLGKFQYKKGEKVNFALGKLDFGEALPTAEGLVTPKELTQDEELVTLILRILQALDSDNNPNNSITIPQSIKTELENIDDEISMADLSQDSDILDIATKFAEALDEDNNGEIDVTALQAKEHFEEHLAKWNDGRRPGDDKEIRPDDGIKPDDIPDGATQPDGVRP